MADNKPINPAQAMSAVFNAKLEQLAMANCATKAAILRTAIVLYELACRACLTDQRGACSMRMSGL